MNWLEFAVTTTGETAEAVSELFNRYGRGGAVIEVDLDCFEHELSAAAPAAVQVKTYLPLDGTTVEARRRLEEGLWHLAQIVPFPPPVVRELAEEDWANAWKQHYHPLRVGRRLVVVPAWEEYRPAPGEIAIRLEPGMAFGTGLHPTTRQCLAALEAHLVPGWSVLDVGTGSGILAIAAAKLGARSVLAVDTDPVAVAAARDNAARNGVADRVEVRRGSLPGSLPPGWAATPWYDAGSGEATPPPDAGSPAEMLDSGQYDLVVINILAPVIGGMAAALAERTAPSGRLIAAGLIDSQEQDLSRIFQEQGFRVIDRAQETDWVALVARRE